MTKSLDTKAQYIKFGETMKITTRTQIDGEDVLDINQVSELTGLNRNKIYELLRYEKMPNPLKAKNKNFWKKSEIEAYIESARQE